jgi:6-phosphogluconolactonase/glucosamine-6-phosphate isomerase/deaminase
LPVLNNSGAICLLVSGAEKAEAVRSGLDDEAFTLPVHRLRPTRGVIRWFIDRDAASLLKERKN